MRQEDDKASLFLTLMSPPHLALPVLLIPPVSASYTSKFSLEKDKCLRLTLRTQEVAQNSNVEPLKIRKKRGGNFL